MTLTDTSVWIRHFRKADDDLCRLLADGQAAMHPFVIGELRCGNLPMRTQTLADFARLPAVTRAMDKEVYQLIEERKLMAIGIGFVDAHLLASCLVDGIHLWTHDRRLKEIAATLGCGIDR